MQPGPPLTKDDVLTALRAAATPVPSRPGWGLVKLGHVIPPGRPAYTFLHYVHRLSGDGLYDHFDGDVSNVKDGYVKLQDN